MNRDNIPRFVLILAIVILAGLAGLGWWWSHKPVVGQLTAIETKSDEDLLYEKYVLNTGKYLSFKHKAIYTEPDSKDNSKLVLEQYSKRTEARPTKKLRVTVTKLASGKLNDLPSYNLRRNDPKQYQPYTIVASYGSVPVMASKTGSELVAFVVRKGLAATIVILSDRPNDDIRAEMEQVVISVVWK